MRFLRIDNAEVIVVNGLSESEGDYIEAIFNLIGEHGHARIADIARA